MADQDDDDEDKTEDATPRRQEEAREKGQVAYSGELLSAVVLIGWTGAMLFAGGKLIGALAGVVQSVVQDAGARSLTDLSPQDISALLTGLASEAFGPALVLMLLSLALAALIGYGQVGFVIATKALEMELSKLDPASGMKKLFSMRAVVRTAMSLVKTLVIAGVTAWMAWLQLDDIVSLVALEIGPALAGVGKIVLKCVSATLAAILAIGAIDYFFQRRQFDKELRMTKKEIKEESRQSEGDPHVKGRIRRMQREMAQSRMMADVPKATVVITNPTHYAIALRYERDAAADQRGAPKVVAKGVDHVAQRIKELARESGVIVYENAPLARTLHARCEIGDDVPVELYQAVAEVLAYVFEVQKGAKARAFPGRNAAALA